MWRLGVTINVLVATLLALIARAVIDGSGLAVDLSMGLIALVLLVAFYLRHEGRRLGASGRDQPRRHDQPRRR
jgi:hypothetical protein